MIIKVTKHETTNKITRVKVDFRPIEEKYHYAVMMKDDLVYDLYDKEHNRVGIEFYEPHEKLDDYAPELRDVRKWHVEEFDEASDD